MFQEKLILEKSPPLTALQGGVMGLVSGSKGGFLTGALCGAVMAVYSAYPAGSIPAVIFALILGLTFGGMAVAFLAGLLGGLVGGGCGLLWSAVGPAGLKPLWFTSWGLATVGGAYLLTAGQFNLAWWLYLLFGLLGAVIAQRDFAKIALLQTSPEETAAP